MEKGILRKLFLSTLYLSAFTFGGGYVIITLMKKKFVDEYHWIEEQEMLDLTALAQSAPGAIAVNGSLIVGFKIAGIPGAAAAVAGTVLPPFFILSVVSFFYAAFRDNQLVSLVLGGMQAGVAAVIADVVTSMGAKIAGEKNVLSLVIMAGAFLSAYVLKVNVIIIILICAGIGMIRGIWNMKRGAKL